jgi:hypothetical protein
MKQGELKILMMKGSGVAYIPGNIAKGPLFYYLDELSRSADSVSRLGSLLQALEQLQPTYQGLIPIFQTYILTDYDPNEAMTLLNHIRDHWFGEANGWWPEEQPIEPIFCQGLIKAIRESVTNPLTIMDPQTQETQEQALPIDTYWICDASHFEILICRSPQQVTLLFLTPSPPVRNPGVWSVDTPVWTVRRDVITVEQQAPATPQAEAIPEGAAQQAPATPQEETPEGTVEDKNVEWLRESRILTIRMRYRLS